MEDIAKLITALGAAPTLLTALLLIWLIFKTRPGAAIFSRLFNGHDKHGSPKRDAAGEASVDYWKNANRETIEKALENHEKEGSRRFDSIEDALRELVEAQHETTREARVNANQIVTSINSLTLAIASSNNMVMQHLRKS